LLRAAFNRGFAGNSAECLPKIGANARITGGGGQHHLFDRPGKNPRSGKKYRGLHHTRTPEASGREAHMNRHHEEISAVTSMLPALSLLIPVAGALWARIKFSNRKRRREGEADV
jgi:hypothetical protein